MESPGLKWSLYVGSVVPQLSRFNGACFKVFKCNNDVPVVKFQYRLVESFQREGLPKL